MELSNGERGVSHLHLGRREPRHRPRRHGPALQLGELRHRPGTTYDPTASSLPRPGSLLPTTGSMPPHP